MKQLKVYSCGLRSVGEVCGSMYELNLSFNDLTHHAMTSLSEFPSRVLNQIHNLNLGCNLLDKMALECLADSLAEMPNLTSLNLLDNPGGDDGMVKVFQSLLATKIHSLSVYETTLGISDIQALSQLIRPGSSLKKLSIGDKDVPCEATIEAILSPSSLEEVELWEIRYRDENVSKFQLLEYNTNLKDLKFNNRLNSLELHLAIAHVAKPLHKNISLKALRMYLERKQVFVVLNVFFADYFLEMNMRLN